MHPFVWFCAILALAVLYGLQLKTVIGRVRAPLLHWIAAVVMVAVLVLGSVLATTYEVKLSHDATVAVQGAILLVCAWLGLRYWTSWRPWDVPAAVMALSLVALFFSDPARYNNAMLTAVSLGMAVGGYYMTKRFLIVFYGLYAVFDLYMVWWSDLADRLEPAMLGPFPISLIVGKVALPFMEISTFDVASGALATVGILRHRGWRRAALFGVLVAGTLLTLHSAGDYLVRSTPRMQVPPRVVGVLISVPLVAVMAPLVWVLLAARKPNRPF